VLALMCNLYSLTKGQAAIVALTRAMMRWGMAAVESHVLFSLES
jgi:hypothetical protein